MLFVLVTKMPCDGKHVINNALINDMRTAANDTFIFLMLSKIENKRKQDEEKSLLMRCVGIIKGQSAGIKKKKKKKTMYKSQLCKSLSSLRIKLLGLFTAGTKKNSLALLKCTEEIVAGNFSW